VAAGDVWELGGGVNNSVSVVASAPGRASVVACAPGLGYGFQFNAWQFNAW
jgi:hypothetical protein